VITVGPALFNVTQAPSGLEPVGVIYPSGSGLTQTFTFHFADPNIY
jgi:hypothetical protein